MSRVRRTVLLLAGLTVVAVLFATQFYALYRYESIPVSFRGMLAVQICQWYVWVVAGPLAWSFATRWPILPGHKLRGAGRHIATGLALSIVILMVYSALYEALLSMPLTSGWYTPIERGRPFRVNLLFFFSAYLHIQLLIYGAVVAIAHAVRSSRELHARERETLQLSAQLTTARLQVLTAQLQPHFLFNTLHTVGSLILQRKNDQAMQMLAELGELLRITLHRQRAEVIPLSDELEHLRLYLRIEETRFADRLSVGWEIVPAALDALVPPLILQPLVENALKHGVAARIEAATLIIRATLAGPDLRISIHNDGPPLPAGWRLESAPGFGLRNVRERLLTRGAGCTLTVVTDDSGVVATIVMPAVTAAKTAVAGG